MTGRLHQVHVEYEPAEDRILLKFNTMDRQELRLWLTRKFVKSFWDALQKLLESMGRAGAQSDPDLRKAMVGLEQERAAPSERFAKDFADEASSFPLGEQPVLVTGFSYKPAKRTAAPGRGGSRGASGRAAHGRIAFETASGHEVGLPADATLLHSLSKMLIGINDRTGWDLRLEPGYALGEQPQRPARMH
jgi:hypothetical protein